MLRPPRTPYHLSVGVTVQEGSDSGLSTTQVGRYHPLRLMVVRLRPTPPFGCCRPPASSEYASPFRGLGAMEATKSTPPPHRGAHIQTSFHPYVVIRVYRATALMRRLPCFRDVAAGVVVEDRPSLLQRRRVDYI